MNSTTVVLKFLQKNKVAINLHKAVLGFGREQLSMATPMLLKSTLMNHTSTYTCAIGYIFSSIPRNRRRHNINNTDKINRSDLGAHRKGENLD